MNVVLNRTVVVVVDSELSVGTNKTVCYILVSTLSGCPYSGVPLYMIFRTTSVSSLFWVAVIQICYVHVQWLATVIQHGDRGWNRTYVPIDINPSKKKKIRAVEELWGWTYSFCFYLRRLECLTFCRCHDKGSTFSSVILRPWVLVRPGFERLLNWANQVTVWNATRLETFLLVYNFNFTVIPF